MKKYYKSLLICILAALCIIGFPNTLNATETSTIYNVTSNQIPLRLSPSGSVKSIIANNAKIKINKTTSTYYNITLITKSSNKYYKVKHKVSGKYYTNFYVSKYSIKLSKIGSVKLYDSNYTYKLPTNKALYNNTIKDCNYYKIATLNTNSVGFYNYNSASSEVTDIPRGTKVAIVDSKGMFTKIEVLVNTEKTGIYKRATYKMPNGTYKAQLCVHSGVLEETTSCAKILKGYNINKTPVRGKYPKNNNVTVSNGKIVVKSDDSVYSNGVEYETERVSSYLESIGSVTLTYKKNDKIYKLVIPSGSYAELIKIDGDYYNVKLFKPCTQSLSSGKTFTYYRQVYLGDTSVYRVKSDVYRTVNDSNEYKIIALKFKYSM